MSIPFEPWVLVQIAIIAQAFFAAGLLWFAPQNRQANRILAVLMICIALWLTDAFWRLAGIYTQDPDWYFSPIYYSFAFGPLLYFYVRSLVNQDFRLRSKHLLHFIPVLLQASLYLYLSFQDYSFRRWFWQEVHRPYTYRIEFDGTWISLLIYSFFAYQIVRRYQQWLDNNYSETEKIKLNWLRVLLVILAVVGVQWFIELILRDFWDIYYQYDLNHWLLGLLVLAMGIAGLYQSSMTGVAFQEPEPEQEPKQKVTLDPDILTRIKKALEQEHLYRNPSLSLSDLATALQLPPKLVSQHINGGFEQSFNDFVNTYRVAEVKNRIQAGELQQMTLLGLAFESGFNSKTSFNRVFKRLAGESPSDYASK